MLCSVCVLMWTTLCFPQPRQDMTTLHGACMHMTCVYVTVGVNRWDTPVHNLYSVLWGSKRLMCDAWIHIRYLLKTMSWVLLLTHRGNEWSHMRYHQTLPEYMCHMTRCPIDMFVCKLFTITNSHCISNQTYLMDCTLLTSSRGRGGGENAKFWLTSIRHGHQARTCSWYDRVLQRGITARNTKNYT